MSLSELLGLDIFHNIMLVEKKKRKHIWSLQTSTDVKHRFICVLLCNWGYNEIKTLGILTLFTVSLNE